VTFQRRVVSIRDASDSLGEYTRRGESRGQQEALVVASRPAPRLANIRYTGA
jgi:hypothetical protein